MHSAKAHCQTLAAVAHTEHSAHSLHSAHSPYSPYSADCGRPHLHTVSHFQMGSKLLLAGRLNRAGGLRGAPNQRRICAPELGAGPRGQELISSNLAATLAQGKPHLRRPHACSKVHSAPQADGAPLGGCWWLASSPPARRQLAASLPPAPTGRSVGQIMMMLFSGPLGGKTNRNIPGDWRQMGARQRGAGARHWPGALAGRLGRNIIQIETRSGTQLF